MTTEVFAGSSHPGVIMSNGVVLPGFALLDIAGNVAKMVSNGDGTATLASAASSAATTAFAQAPTAAAASGATAGFSTVAVSQLAVDLNVTVITAGTAPTITFYIDRLGADGTWYQIWASAAVSAVGAVSASVGAGQSAVATLTSQARLRWIFGGTVVATSITFSASVVGR